MSKWLRNNKLTDEHSTMDILAARNGRVASLRLIILCIKFLNFRKGSQGGEVFKPLESYTKKAETKGNLSFKIGKYSR